LNQKLDSVNLRQLKQRIALRCHLEPLTEEETRAYIRRRLQLAGVNPETTIFTDDAAAAIYRHSRGIPRLINTVCENALIAAYAHQASQIHSDVIDEVASDLRLGVVTTESDDLPIEDSGDQLRRAANTLLQFHDFLQNTRTKQSKPQVVIRRGIREHEPLI
jgi:general secretion pathway protein A